MRFKDEFDIGVQLVKDVPAILTNNIALNVQSNRIFALDNGAGQRIARCIRHCS